MRRTLWMAAALLSSPAVAAPLWLHVEVQERRGSRAEVRVNLPVRAVVRAVPLVPEPRAHRCRIALGEEGLTGRDLAAIRAELARVPAGTIVTRDTGELDVAAVRTGDRVELRLAEKFGRDTVTTSIPAPVLDALVGSGGRRLDLAAAVRELGRRGGGELVLLDADGTRIRIWIDETPVQGGRWR